MMGIDFSELSLLEIELGNFEKARYFLESKALNGDENSINLISAVYRCGVGVAQDVTKSEYWLSLKKQELIK